MPGFVILIVALVAVLVWVGRKPARASRAARLWRAAFAALAAVGSVVSALRGGWIASLALIALSAWFAQGVRSAGAAAPAATGQNISLHEARTILGVTETAGRADIDTAYRRLMLRAHPDHGGSTGLAARLNEARNRLIGR